MNVIFMGTPDFALPAFQELIDSKNHNVVAVFTQRPKAKGRGMKMSNSPIHDLADKYNIPVHTPKTLRNDEAQELIDSIDADIIVVVAYGFIIPKNILEAKKHGCLNIHPSKLPKYRGAAPLQRTIINGEKETAICIMQMDEGLDTGDIILQKDLKLDDRITLPQLHDNCAKIGGELLIEVLDNIDSLPRIKQSEEGLCYAHKLSKEEGKIDWRENSFAIDCKIRGMNPWPGVYFEYEGKIVKIISATYTEKKHDFLPGKIMGKNCEVACGSGTLIIESLKPEGKKQMPAADFLRGIAKDLNEVVFV